MNRTGVLALRSVLACGTLALGCRPEDASTIEGDTTGATSVGDESSETTGEDTGPLPKPEPPDLPRPDGAHEPGCYNGIRKTLIDGGPVTGLALWSDGTNRVVAGANAVRRLSDDDDTIPFQEEVVDVAFGSTEDAHVLLQHSLSQVSATSNETIFKGTSNDDYVALTVTDSLEALIVGEHTFCNQEDEVGYCQTWLSRGAFWRVPDSEPRLMHDRPSSVASHGAGEAIVASPDRVHFIGELESYAVATSGGQVWLDRAGGYFIAIEGQVHHYVPGGELVPLHLPGIAASETIVAFERDPGGALRAVVSDDVARVRVGDELSVVALELPPDRTVGRGAFARGSVEEVVASGPLGAELWSLDTGQPFWDANIPHGSPFYFGLRPDETGFAVNGSRSLYARAADGRWSEAAELPIEGTSVVPWKDGAMVASESSVYEWTGTTFVERTPEVGTERIEDMMAQGDELWVLSRSDPWRAPPSVFHWHDETWTKTSVPHTVTELVPSEDGPVVFPPSVYGGFEWGDGQWIDIEAKHWWHARAYAVASTGDIYAIIRFSAGSWGIGRLDRSTAEWTVEPVPARQWLWIGARGSHVWTFASGAVAHFDGQQWHARALEPRGAAGRALTADGVLVHERDRIVRVEPCDR